MLRSRGVAEMSSRADFVSSVSRADHRGDVKRFSAPPDGFSIPGVVTPYLERWSPDRALQCLDDNTAIWHEVLRSVLIVPIVDAAYMFVEIIRLLDSNKSELAEPKSFCGRLFPLMTIRQKWGKMMFRKTLTSVALAAGLRWRWPCRWPGSERALRWSSGCDPQLRQSRIDTECGAIGNAHLRASCIDSLNIDEDRRSPGWRDGLTGGGTGMMNPIQSQAPIVLTCPFPTPADKGGLIALVSKF